MHVSRPYRVGIIAALALLCMAPNPAAARTSEKSPKTPEIAGDIAAVALPAAGLIVSETVKASSNWLWRAPPIWPSATG